MKKLSNFAGLATLMLLLVACHSEPSLQKYFVENQDEADFVVIDVPASLFLSNNSQLSAENQKALNSIKKANVLAFPVNDNNRETYKKQLTKIKRILNDERYKLLMNVGFSGKNVKVLYLGDADAIDEIIVFGNDDQKGFGVVRILGDHMNPSTMMKLMQSASKGNINVKMGAFGGIGKIFGKGKEDASKNSSDSLKTKDSI